MSVAYFDCFSGVSGNMVLGALLDAGLELEDLQEQLDRLDVSGYTLRVETVRRAGLRGTHVTVEIEEHGPERHLHDIEAIITSSGLPERIQRQSVSIFRSLAEAEAKVHGMPVDHVHFHEVGALDAIVDVVGAVLGLDLLGVDRVFASLIHLGRGTVTCAHGVMPVPAPATAELLKGVPTYGRDVDAELVTPTGAAILTTLVEHFGAAPPMTVTQIGYGAGTRDLPHPNLLRLSIGEIGSTPSTMEDAFGYEQDRITVVETNVDDMNPEFYDYVIARLFDAGALDVFITRIMMKHGRPGVQLTALAAEDYVPGVVDILFRETTTIGVRFRTTSRWKLRREQIMVETPYGAVSVKVASRGEAVLNAAPELRACRRLAQERDVPLKVVYQTAQQAALDCLAQRSCLEQDLPDIEGERGSEV